MKKDTNRFAYIPSKSALFVDLILLSFAVLIVVWLSPVPFLAFFRTYFRIGPYYIISWLVVSYLLMRYAKKRTANYDTNISKLFWVVIIVQSIFGLLRAMLLISKFSIRLSISLSIFLFSFGAIYYILLYVIKNAIEYKDYVVREKDEEEE